MANQASAIFSDETVIGGGLTGKAAALHIAIINRRFSSHIQETFEPILSEISTKKEDHKPDLRWGVFFYHNQDHEVATLFVDKFGRYGYLGNTMVSFETRTLSPNLARQLHRLIGDFR